MIVQYNSAVLVTVLYITKPISRVLFNKLRDLSQKQLPPTATCCAARGLLVSFQQILKKSPFPFQSCQHRLSALESRERQVLRKNLAALSQARPLVSLGTARTFFLAGNISSLPLIVRNENSVEYSVLVP